VDLTSVALLRDHARVLERAKVFYKRLAGYWKFDGNARRGRGAHCEALEQLPARWIRERDEHRVIHVQPNSCTWARRLSNRLPDPQVGVPNSLGADRRVRAMARIDDRVVGEDE
jgi:hypothetical protein